jgi:hypothetical protein
MSHDRNTVPAKCAIYGTFTAVSLPFLNVYVNEKGGIRSFTIVVSIDLGTISSEMAVVLSSYYINILSTNLILVWFFI